MNRVCPRTIRLALCALLAASVVAIAPMTAAASARIVTLGNSSFSPANLMGVARGTTVRWVNPKPAHGGFLAHDVTSTAPSGYFVSGPPKGISPGESYSFTFRSAGRFAYLCTVHAGMVGSVRVPVAVAKLTGPVRFRITVASASASASWRHQVQVRRPGGQAWVTIGTTRATSVVWTPSVRGTYRFRARVINAVSGATSGWSAGASATF